MSNAALPKRYNQRFGGKGNNEVKKCLLEPTLPKLISELNQYIIGQNVAIKQLALAMYRSFVMQGMKSNILIIGKSGCGKTATVKQLARILGSIYTIEDATKYTKEGYHGSDVEEMIFNLYDKSGKNLKEAVNGILVIDEIDKKVSREFDDVSGTAVYQSLLKIIEGCEMIVDVTESGQSIFFDTSNLKIILMGAFEGLDKIRDARLKGKKTIGFVTNGEEKSNKSMAYTKEDLISYGMPAEFVGRINTIIEFETLSVENLVEIVKNSKLSSFKKYQEYFTKIGIELVYDNNIFKEIAKEAYNAKTGARDLENVINKMFEEILFQIFSHEYGHFCKCALIDIHNFILE